MRPILFASITLLLASFKAAAFCGFFVAKADTKLFNKASQVVIARDEDKTILTMANDFQGPHQEFAVVIPVPTVIKKEQVFVIEKKYIDHLDAYTAPRLVEYFDEDPCMQLRYEMAAQSAPGAPQRAMLKSAERSGVKIEESFTVGEYDILVLSAKESSGLVSWLKDNGYKLPKGAEPVVKSYLGQNMKFFVAKVNLQEQLKAGFTYLRPLQVAYESPKFMLPIRLGTVNADGPQELFVYALTRKGRVESTNYRTVKLPSDMDIPVHIKGEFAEFYKAMFSEQVRKEDMRTLFLEYAWDMGWCDPCAADPLSADEVKKLGVFWLPKDQGAPGAAGRGRAFVPPVGAGVQDVFVTRLHVRYTRDKFPDDLIFQETANKENFQGRYILRHPWTGEVKCDAAKNYKTELARRREQEAKTLAQLTGWEINGIRKKMNVPGPAESGSELGSGKKWWER